MNGATTDTTARVSGVLPVMRAGLDLRSLWLPVFTALCLLLYVPYTTGAMQWFFKQGYVPFKPVAFMVGCGCAVLALALLKRPQFAPAVLLVVGLVAARAGDATFLQRFVFPGEQKIYIFILMGVGFMALVSAALAGVMQTASRLPVLAVAGATVLVCTCVNLYEFLGFATYSTVDGRAAGWLEDANNSAIAITLMLGVFVTCQRGFWLNALMVGIAGAGVFVTLSRSGILVYAVMLVAWVALNLRDHFARLLVIAALAVPLATAGVGAMVATSSKAAGVKGDSNVEGRLAAILEGDVDKMMSNERAKDLADGLRGVAEAPLSGLGTGAGTGLYMPHNQLISVWIDVGVIGVLLYGGLLAVLGWKCLASGFRGLLCLIPLVGFVPFSQVLVETAAYWLCALVLVAVTTERAVSFSLMGRRVANGTDGGGALPEGGRA